MRQFEAKPAVRERVPIWIALSGTPGSGKTFSALRLATGIARQNKGDVYVIDTEARRALHYADRFAFRHVDMVAPHGSADYLACIRHCVAQGAGVVVIDSASHEHEGAGGYLDYHATELDRLAGDDYAKRIRVNWQAYGKPSASRTKYINDITQIGASFIFCFRAKEKSKMQKAPNGKTEIVELGTQPIAPLQMIYGMTISAILKPRSGGVPTFDSDNPHEAMVTKLEEQFRDMFADRRPLDEKHGEQLAQWAMGAPPAAERSLPPEQTRPPEVLQQAPAPGAEDLKERAHAALMTAATNGTPALQTAWKALPKFVQEKLKTELDANLKPIAEKWDKVLANMPVE